jgi:hypothetical protein
MKYLTGGVPVTSKTWISAITAVILTLSVFGVAFAQENQDDDKLQGYIGTVVSYETSTGMLVVELKDATSTEIIVTISETTRIKAPGVNSAVDEITPTTLALALEDGITEVAVLADEDGNARQLMIKPGKPTAPPVTGAVVSKETNGSGITTLTITRKDGTTMTIRLGSGVSLPDVGELVTAFAPVSEGEPPVAKGLVKAEEVKQRLDRFAARLVDDANETPGKGRLLNNLARALEGFSSQREATLQAIIARAPEAAQKGLQNALERASRGRADAQEKAADAREKAGPPEGRGGPNANGSDDQQGRGNGNNNSSQRNQTRNLGRR